MYFKIALRVIAYRAYFRCFCSHYDMSTITAFPYFDFALFKYLCSFNILKKCTISFFMMFLNLSYSSKFCCKFWKSFFLRCFGKPFLHICPLVVFTFCSSGQIFFCVTNSGQLLEPHLCMFFLIIGCF